MYVIRICETFQPHKVRSNIGNILNPSLHLLLRTTAAPVVQLSILSTTVPASQKEGNQRGSVIYHHSRSYTAKPKQSFKVTCQAKGVSRDITESSLDDSKRSFEGESSSRLSKGRCRSLSNFSERTTFQRWQHMTRTTSVIRSITKFTILHNVYLNGAHPLLPPVVRLDRRWLRFGHMRLVTHPSAFPTQRTKGQRCPPLTSINRTCPYLQS